MKLSLRIRWLFALSIAVASMAGLGLVACAQTYAPSDAYVPSYAPAPPVSAPYTSQTTAYTADQLDQMLAPIALYPDPLLSQALAAATYPQDIAAANQWLQYNPNPSDADLNNQPWDTSVKGLAHFPQVIKMMAENLDWTESLGAAFANQQPDVMDSIQRLRAMAQADHTLNSTPQQEVVNDGGAIEIVPAQPDVICVPEYNPDIIYAAPEFPGPFITFGAPCPFGAFLDLDFDFHHHRFFRGVHFDREHHRPIFDRGQPWQHDVRRPIPQPRRPFFPPRGPDIHRGWGQPGRTPGAFNPAVRPRAIQPPRTAEHPVTGLPRIPARPMPAPARPLPTPARPLTPAAPRRIPAFPRNIPRPAPARPATPPPRIERPITGLPARPAPVARPAPAVRPAPIVRPSPAPRVAPAPRIAPTPRSAPAPAFRPGDGGGAASERGHGSMHR